MEIVRVLNDLIYYQHVFTLENERFQSQGLSIELLSIAATALLDTMETQWNVSQLSLMSKVHKSILLFTGY